MKKDMRIYYVIIQGSDRFISIREFWFARWIKYFFLICDSLERIILFFDSDSFWSTFDANESHWFILLDFDFDFDSLWFTIHLDFYSLRFAIQFDFIHFDSVWFWFVANHDFATNFDLPANQKSNRIKNRRYANRDSLIGWFDFESKANQSKSQIKLVRALV